MERRWLHAGAVPDSNVNRSKAYEGIPHQPSRNENSTLTNKAKYVKTQRGKKKLYSLDLD